jgi:hypothetical protein
MTQVKTLLLVASCPLLLIACGGGNDAPAPSVTCTNGNITAKSANNYSFASTITLPPVTVKSMANLTFSWGGVSKDFLGHTVNPVADLNTVLVMLWDMPLAEFQTQLNADALFTSDLVVSPPPSINPTGGATTANLYDLTINGTPITSDMYNMYFDAGRYPATSATFLVAAQTGTDLGRGIRMLQTFKLDPASTVTTVTLTNTSTMLDYHANLHTLHPTGVPAGTAAMMLDWGQMTTNALGAEFITTNITSAIVGHYTQTPAELESKFLDLETSATDLYRADIVSGTVLDFTTLKTSSGKSFTGVDTNGTWLVGLTCGNCRNPAPWYMTILVPATQPCAP